MPFFAQLAIDLADLLSNGQPRPYAALAAKYHLTESTIRGHVRKVRTLGLLDEDHKATKKAQALLDDVPAMPVKRSRGKG